MDNNNIIVSVFCLAYNHGPYIRDCLEGFVNQKTNFKFEVLIHDDASTDNTADIIKEYEENYPEIIKPIYQKENQCSKGVSIAKTFQIPRAQGKYYVWCEGDDYWCDENKLQRQFDIMEANPNCGICVHDTICVNEDGSKNDRVFPPIHVEEGVINGKQMFRNYSMWVFHLSSYFVRKDLFLQLYNDHFELVKSCPVGDKLIFYYFSLNGDVYFINKAMSTYRLFSVNSWTSRHSDTESLIEHDKKFISFSEVLKQYLINEKEEEQISVVDNAIIRFHCNIYLRQGKYKDIYQFRKSDYFKSFNKKLKAVIYLSAIIPGFFALYSRYRKQKDDKNVK